MSTDLLERSAVKREDQWDLEVMFKDIAAWQKEFTDVEQEIPGLASFQGKLTEKMAIKNCLETISAWERRLEKLYVYASLRFSEDLGNSDAGEKLKRMQILASQFSQVTAYVTPELTALAEDLLQELIADADLEEQRMSLRAVLRSKKHVLSDPEERLLARAGVLWSDPYTIFGSFDNVDADFQPVTDSSGNQVPVTHGTYAKLLEKRDRNVRQAAFESIYKEYAAHAQTLADVLHAKVKQHDFFKDVRNYDSALAQALHGNDIATDVYRNLISQVHEHLPAFYEYVDKRKELLGLDDLAMWDLRVPLNDVDFHFSYEEAVDLVCTAAKSLGEDYVKVMREGLNGGWVDRYENKGKRSGAFSSGCYDSVPYILMNFTGTLNDVFTLMHEAGHSMHTYLANQNQPYDLASYPIYTAEIASTVNERLLVSHLLETLEGDERVAVLHYEIDAIRATFFRQTMFAEFELLIHEAVGNGQPLTKDFFCSEYKRLNELYYGDSMANDEYIQYEWARIPHFYYNFYVYQYATGIAAAYNFAQTILSGAPDKYLNLLKSGGSDYPLDLLKTAGLDMTKSAMYIPITERFAELVQGL